jgi:hypothetical protein
MCEGRCAYAASFKQGEDMIFFGGLFMIVVSFVVFVMFCDPINSSKDRGTWFEDACAATMMLGFGVAVIGALIWIGKVLA